MPYEMDSQGKFPYPYEYPYLGWSRCRRFPWLPRWWWTGIYGPIQPYPTPSPQGIPPIFKEEKIVMLEDETRMLEQKMELIRKRLEELKK
jgi:hypothetical protein